MKSARWSLLLSAWMLGPALAAPAGMPSGASATSAASTASTAAATPATASASPAAAGRWPVPADHILAEVNRVRAALGLRPLRPSGELEQIASGHSRAMAALRRPSHDGFDSRLDSTSASICVENVASGFTSAGPMVAAWHAAPAHRRNLYEPRVTRVGIGSVGRYVTLFACD